MGDVDVSVKDDTGWKYETTVHGKKEAILLNSDSFINVKPGDKFVREVEIENGSNIDTDLVIEGGYAKPGTKLADAINDGFIKITDNREELIKSLNNNDEHNEIFGTNVEKKSMLKIMVEVQSRTSDEDNKYNSNGRQIIDFNFEEDINPYVINATQELSK